MYLSQINKTIEWRQSWVDYWTHIPEERSFCCFGKQKQTKHGLEYHKTTKHKFTYYL